jgi:hypothetical protein
MAQTEKCNDELGQAPSLPEPVMLMLATSIVPALAATQSNPQIIADQVAEPDAFATLTDQIRAPGATPTTPVPLSRAAATPATLVP